MAVKTVRLAIHPAVIIMVDSNLQRENILPSERAKAYQMKYEAIKHQGQRGEPTSGQVVQKSQTSLEQVAEGTGESGKTVQRVMRLTSLVPRLMDMVDERKVAMNPAYELSFLRPEEQEQLVEAMEAAQSSPSLSQAQRMKKLSQQGQLTTTAMEAIMSEEKKPPLEHSLDTDPRLLQCFPAGTSPEEISAEIIRVMQIWRRLERFLPQAYTTEQKGQAIVKFLENLQRKRQQQRHAPER